MRNIKMGKKRIFSGFMKTKPLNIQNLIFISYSYFLAFETSFATSSAKSS